MPEDFDQAFGVELALHTRVLVSGMQEHPARNNVMRFVRLGNVWYPLNFDDPQQCVALEPLDRQLRADGWGGRRAATEAGVPAEVWLYRRGRTQLWAEPMGSKAAGLTGHECAASILLTFR